VLSFFDFLIIIILLFFCSFSLLYYNYNLFYLARSFEISLQHNCIKLKCYITLEKDKDAKKKRNEQQQHQQQHSTPTSTSASLGLSGGDSQYGEQQQTLSKMQANSGGAKKVNVEVIMKSNPFRVG
jgi:hypothetical protein